MRAVLSLFLSALLLATSCAYAQTDEIPYQIDEQATAKAPWKVGDTIAEDLTRLGSKVYRKFMGITSKGYFVVQDFYAHNNQKTTNPIAITQQGFVMHIEQSYEIRPFDGMWVVWYETGQKKWKFYLKTVLNKDFGLAGIAIGQNSWSVNFRMIWCKTL